MLQPETILRRLVEVFSRSDFKGFGYDFLRTPEV